ncbi:MAG: ATP-binding cassette domain-containing protein [Roseburia sp.]|nr:ATP-binding cassette domain-containing protein [Roseburia sp.]
MNKNKKLIILLGWLLVWQLVSMWVGNDILMVGPVATGAALLRNIAAVSFWRTVGCSLLRIAAGFLAGVLAGLGMAALSARFPLLEQILSPALSLVKAIPVASFVVLFLIWWRSDVLSVVISFCVVLPNIYINTLEGFRSTDRRLLEMAKVFCIRGRDRFFYIYRPALKPFLDSSIRISVGMSWKSGVAAEVIGTPLYSIGERLYMSKIYLDTAGVLSWTAVTILLSVAFERLVLYGWEGFCKWEPVCRRNGMAADAEGSALRVEALSKSYGAHLVLDKISARYERGRTYYFRSPSGSGKTTYFRLIAGLEQPDSGGLYWDKSDERVSMVFQEDRLLEAYSAVKNVELATGSRERARAHLAQLLAEEDMDRPCRELSGGMKRRVAIARAYAADSDFLLLDEPFTGMDEATRERVLAYMEAHQRGRTVLIATHQEI